MVESVAHPVQPGQENEQPRCRLPKARQSVLITMERADTKPLGAEMKMKSSIVIAAIAITCAACNPFSSDSPSERYFNDRQSLLDTGFTEQQVLSVEMVAMAMAQDKVCGLNPKLPANYMAYLIRDQSKEGGLTEQMLIEKALPFVRLRMEWAKDEKEKSDLCKSTG